MAKRWNREDVSIEIGWEQGQTVTVEATAWRGSPWLNDNDGQPTFEWLGDPAFLFWNPTNVAYVLITPAAAVVEGERNG
jgi:hypothetical protein